MSRAENVVLALVWTSMGLGVIPFTLALNLLVVGRFAEAGVAAFAIAPFAIVPVLWYRHNNRELRRLRDAILTSADER